MWIWSVLIAAGACWGIGAIYYGVFSKSWLSAIGKTKEDIADGSMTPYLISLIAEIVAVTMMYHIFAATSINTIGAGALSGAGIGAFLVGAWIFINNAYEGHSIRLSIINAGYSTIGLGAAGAILGYFIV